MNKQNSTCVNSCQHFKLSTVLPKPSLSTKNLSGGFDLKMETKDYLFDEGRKLVVNKGGIVQSTEGRPNLSDEC